MTDTRIVTTHYRYKRPPRKKQAVALDGLAGVAAKSDRRQVLGGGGREGGQASPRERGSTKPSPPSYQRRPEASDRHGEAETPQRGGPAAADGTAAVPPAAARDGDDHKRLKAAMARRLRGE
jgi:hypothetical protein